MNIIECRVIRPKDRNSVVLATAEILFDNGIRLINMHLLRPREGQTSNQLKMPSITTNRGTIISAFNPSNQETRAAMHEAVEETLAEAVEAQVNDYTKTYAELQEPGMPRFSNLRLHKFPDNNIPVKAMVSVTIDNCIRLNRIAVIKNPETSMYVVQLPKFSLQNGRRTMRYFRFPSAAYEGLYKLVMEEYMKPTAEDTAGKQESA